MNILVQNNYLLPHRLVPFLVILKKKSILASGLYYANRDCYCSLLFPNKLFTFPMNLCLWE